MIGRDEALATLAEGNEALDRLLAQLSDVEMERPNAIGGGEWSAKDLLGHMAFWEELALDLIAAAREGRRPERIGSVDEANARNQERTRAQSLAEVRARAAASHAAVLDAIRTMRDAEWSALAPGARKRSLGERVGGTLGAPKRPFGHAFAHLTDLRAYVVSLRG